MNPSSIKLSNGSIVNFYGWADKNGYGATYYSVGQKTRSGFIFNAHFTEYGAAVKYRNHTDEKQIVVKNRVGITNSEIIDDVSKKY